MEKALATKLGYIMIGIEGKKLKQHERAWLQDPAVAGVILFQRNFESINQLQALCAEIHRVRHPRLLVGVDHEGGRVQRFAEGFTRLPAMAALGELFLIDSEAALATAEQLGWLAATELLACGVDLSFAPVLDINYGHNQVIGSRAFAKTPYHVTQLALAFSKGMLNAGMAPVAKHFPGHGYVTVDTHLDIAEDTRSYLTLDQQDMMPFKALIEADLPAIMPAHVIYSDCDPYPAGFSIFWLQRVLRERLGYQGAIISDDLGMQAAVVTGALSERVNMAITAGCDLVLVCNDLDAIPGLLKELSIQLKLQNQPQSSLSQLRLIRLHGRKLLQDFASLKFNPDWQAAQVALDKMNSRLSSLV